MFSCDCGLTAGCEKCNLQYIPYHIGDVDVTEETTQPIYVNLSMEEVRLIYHRVMAVAKAKAIDDAPLYGALVDAVYVLRKWAEQEKIDR